MSYLTEVLADSPGGYWPLEEASGTVLDESSNSNTGTVSGTITRQAVGLISSGYSYDHATSGIITIAHHATLQAASCTVECWVSFDVLPASDGDGGNITFLAKAPYWMRLLRIAGVTYFHMYWLNDVGGGTWAGLLSTTPITTGVTYHLASTYSGTTARLYLDGVQEAIDTGFTSLRIDGTDDLTMGSSVFDGRLDEVAMYPSALGVDRILAHYEAGIAPPIAASQTGNRRRRQAALRRLR